MTLRVRSMWSPAFRGSTPSANSSGFGGRPSMPNRSSDTPFSFTREVNEDHEEESDGNPRGRSETPGRKDTREQTNHEEGHGESNLGGGCEHLDRVPCRRSEDNVWRRSEQSNRQIDRRNGHEADKK